MTMSDDELDGQVRAAMKTLDAEAPSGYFEALPDLTLARLEQSMHSTGTGQTSSSAKGSDPTAAISAGIAAPKSSGASEAAASASAAASPSASGVPTATTDESSGLHDIRSLAQSTKQRLTKRSPTSQPMSDEDVLASSSAGWKAVALPEPARMVSLPELDALPSKREVLAKEEVARVAREQAATVGSAAGHPVEVSSSVSDLRTPFSLPSQAKARSNRTLAVVGLGLAAAAGAAIFVMTRPPADKAAPVATATSPERARAEPAAAPTPPPAQIAAPAAAETPPADEAKDDAAAGAPGPGAVAATKAAPPSKAASGAKHGKLAVDHSDKTSKPIEVTPTKEEAKPAKPKGKGGDEGSGDPSFDQLLKEAGVDQNKKPTAPKLEKKALSGEDFKHGMAAVAAKAQACYKGTQGTASVKLVIAPSGQVSKVSVGGQFANGPEAECVANAVRSASFPPWDGGPQSFNYSYLLSE